MAELDNSREIEFVLDDRVLTMEERHKADITPIAKAIGQYAYLGRADAILWWEQVFEMLINAGREILAEQKNDQDI